MGEDFDGLAAHFAPALRTPIPGAATLLRLLRLTKTRRSPYDALMLQLHDRMKQDSAYQASVGKEPIPFPSRTTWITFTDSVSHR